MLAGLCVKCRQVSISGGHRSPAAWTLHGEEGVGTKSSGCSQPTKSKPGQSCEPLGPPEQCSSRGCRERFWNDRKLRRFSITLKEHKTTGCCYLASPCQCGGIEDGHPLLRTTGLCSYLGSSRHVQRVKGLPCQ